jgi:hypothetical protein
VSGPRKGEREAELLAWLLDPPTRAGRERSELERRPEDARRLAELEGFIARCRAAGEQLEAFAPGRQRSLVERVLARTTREDLSWRGDLRLFGGFVLQRLRTSPALRLAAASLLVHLFALPLLAWYGLARLDQEREPVIRFAPLLPDPAFEERRERAPVVESRPLDPLEVELELSERDPALYVANSLAWARYQLEPAPPELPAERADEGSAAAILRGRRRVLAERTAELPAGLAETRGPGAALAERALDCELLLDLALVGAARPARLEAALRTLAGGRLPADASGLLAAAALARAESYGMLPGEAVDALGQARLALAGFPEAELLTGAGHDLRRVAPLGPVWLRALRAARRELGLPAELVEALASR